MQDFMKRAATLASENNYEADDVHAWAVRAFSALAVVGGFDSTDDHVGESLAIVLSKAPTEVVADGALNLINAQFEELTSNPPQ